MREVTLLLSPEESPVGEPALVDIDVCTSCHVVFFDADELEQLPLQPVGLKRGPPAPIRVQSPRPDSPPPMLDAELAYTLDRIQRDAGDYEDVTGWKYLLAMFAPVEVNPPAVSRAPVVTWTVGVLLVVVALFTFGDLGTAIEGWAFVPAEPFRKGGVTWVTSFLLHGGVLHLLGNLWFLLIFGDNVEDFLGSKRFAAVLAGAAFAGTLLHMLADPSSSIPLVGASGGISGVMILYGARFPQARLGLVIWFRWFTLPAVVYMAFWVGMQLLGSFAGMATGGGGVAYLAHLGGAIVGLAAWWTWGRKA